MSILCWRLSLFILGTKFEFPFTGKKLGDSPVEVTIGI